MHDVFIIDGCRTPFIKADKGPNPLSAADLAVACGQQLLAKMPFAATDIGEVIVGCVAPRADEANIARLISLRLGCGDQVPAWTVQRNCASGLQALDCAFKDIACGRYDVVLAGGTEAMSRTPLLLNDDMVKWLTKFNLSKNITNKLINLIKFRIHFLKPVIALLKGLTDPIVNLSMGQTAEKLAFQFDIARQEMDNFAVQSHLRAVKAQDENYFVDELVPLYNWAGQYIAYDNGIRLDSTVEKLAKLKPVFEKPFGQITAGNSSQITDGAAFLMLASKQAIKKYNLRPLARIKDIAWAGLDPSIMGLGPAYAIALLLSKNKLSLSDIDYWEINEAFAAQVIACQKAMNSETYCQSKLGLDRALGQIDNERLNIDGGAIALGHPVGASGARIVLHLLHVLLRNKATRGVASLCIGGGQGGALLLESANAN